MVHKLICIFEIFTYRRIFSGISPFLITTAITWRDFFVAKRVQTCTLCLNYLYLVVELRINQLDQVWKLFQASYDWDSLEVICRIHNQLRFSTFLPGYDYPAFGIVTADLLRREDLPIASDYFSFAFGFAGLLGGPVRGI